jgi:hypothetical protein
MNDIVAEQCALKKLASYLHANGRQLRSSFPNPPVYNDNPRSTSFRSMMDNDQIVITRPTIFCHGSWSDTSVTLFGILSPGKKTLPCNFQRSGYQRPQVPNTQGYICIYISRLPPAVDTSCNPLASQALQHVAMLRFQFLLATGPEACTMACPQSSEYLQSKAPFLADAV